MMKMKLLIYVQALLLLIPLSIVSAQSGGGAAMEKDSLIGVKVYGPGNNSIGRVTGVVREGSEGSAVMYVVEGNGLFAGKGVIPFTHVTNEVEVPTRNGKTEYRIDVSVNNSTFKNIANWYARETFPDYIGRQGSILTTIYGLEKDLLDDTSESLVYDESANFRNDSSMVSL